MKSERFRIRLNLIKKRIWFKLSGFGGSKKLKRVLISRPGKLFDLVGCQRITLVKLRLAVRRSGQSLAPIPQSNFQTVRSITPASRFNFMCSVFFRGTLELPTERSTRAKCLQGQWLAIIQILIRFQWNFSEMILLKGFWGIDSKWRRWLTKLEARRVARDGQHRAVMRTIGRSTGEHCSGALELKRHLRRWSKRMMRGLEESAVQLGIKSNMASNMDSQSAQQSFRILGSPREHVLSSELQISSQKPTILSERDAQAAHAP